MRGWKAGQQGDGNELLSAIGARRSVYGTVKRTVETDAATRWTSLSECTGHCFVEKYNPIVKALLYGRLEKATLCLAVQHGITVECLPVQKMGVDLIAGWIQCIEKAACWTQNRFIRTTMTLSVELIVAPNSE